MQCNNIWEPPNPYLGEYIDREVFQMATSNGSYEVPSPEDLLLAILQKRYASIFSLQPLAGFPMPRCDLDALN